MSLLRRIGKRPTPPVSVLESLLKKLRASGQLEATLAQVIAERDDLTAAQTAAIERDAIAFLLSENSQRSPQPQTQVQRMPYRRYIPDGRLHPTHNLPLDVRRRVRIQFMGELDFPTMGFTEEALTPWRGTFEAIIQNEGLTMTAAEVDSFWQEAIYELIGFGPLEWLLADPSISEIFIMGWRDLRIRRGGEIQVPQMVSFEDEDHLYRIIDRVLPTFPRRPTRTDSLQSAKRWHDCQLRVPELWLSAADSDFAEAY